MNEEVMPVDNAFKESCHKEEEKNGKVTRKVFQFVF